jgi:Zn-dependent M28 family amino/carboxypeptidase
VQIGREDYKQFQKWLNQGKIIRVRVDVGGEVLPSLTSQNVIGTLKGKTIPQEEIVVSAHYDSAYMSPGAWDNASGVEGMLRVAERLARRGTHKTVRFIAFGCEEYLMLGSYYYVETLKEQGLLSKIKAVINLDAIGGGETLHVLVAPRGFRRMVEAIVEESGLKEEVKIVFEDPVGDSDHWPFHLEGIPVVTSYFWPYDYYHQPMDTAEKIKEDAIEKTAKVMQTIAERLAYALC